jgi:hypothetical protein
LPDYFRQLCYITATIWSRDGHAIVIGAGDNYSAYVDRLVASQLNTVKEAEQKSSRDPVSY